MLERASQPHARLDRSEGFETSRGKRTHHGRRQRIEVHSGFDVIQRHNYVPLIYGLEDVEGPWPGGVSLNGHHCVRCAQIHAYCRIHVVSSPIPLPLFLNNAINSGTPNGKPPSPGFERPSLSRHVYSNAGARGHLKPLAFVKTRSLVAERELLFLRVFRETTLPKGVEYVRSKGT